METTTRTWISWRPAILSGLIAGLVFLILEMVMVPLFLGVSPWALVRMIGAIVLGQGVLPPSNSQSKILPLVKAKLFE